MAATDFLHDPQVRKWLDGIEPAWTLLTFDSLRALRQEPSAGQAAIRIANDLSGDEISGSALARNTFILLRQAIERQIALERGQRGGDAEILVGAVEAQAGAQDIARRIGQRDAQPLAPDMRDDAGAVQGPPVQGPPVQGRLVQGWAGQ